MPFVLWKRDDIAGFLVVDIGGRIGGKGESILIAVSRHLRDGILALLLHL